MVNENEKTNEKTKTFFLFFFISLTSPPAILCFLVLPPEAPFCPDPQVPENVNASANIYKFTMLSITVSDRDDRLFFLKKVEETQFLRSL